jgi:hypothetical protein
MVKRIKGIFDVYEESVWKMPSMPKFSKACGLLRKSASRNRNFLAYVFGHQELAVQFLKEVGLIRCNVRCNFCERNMT